MLEEAIARASLPDSLPVLGKRTLTIETAEFCYFFHVVFLSPCGLVEEEDRDLFSTWVW